MIEELSTSDRQKQSLLLSTWIVTILTIVMPPIAVHGRIPAAGWFSVFFLLSFIGPILLIFIYLALVGIAIFNSCRRFPSRMMCLFRDALGLLGVIGLTVGISIFPDVTDAPNSEMIGFGHHIPSEMATTFFVLTVVAMMIGSCAACGWLALTVIVASRSRSTPASDEQILPPVSESRKNPYQLQV